jgi:outer membrane phospholipase A
MPTYVIGGGDDLKIQFSSKYQVAKKFNLYMAYTQTMFWSIYESSMPFKDINFAPELFYRILDNDSGKIQSIDFGVTHNSNGKNGIESRSLNRIFLKLNQVHQINRNQIYTEARIYKVYNPEAENHDIEQYLGFWDLQVRLTNLIVKNDQRLDIEFKIFAGSKVINIDKGGTVLGLIYRTGSESFNPAIYLQYYQGTAESLLNYQDKVDEWRIGFLLTSL